MTSPGNAGSGGSDSSEAGAGNGAFGGSIGDSGAAGTTSLGGSTSSGGSAGKGGSTAKAGKGGQSSGSAGSSTGSPLPTAEGEPDPNAPPTALKPLPAIQNVKAVATGDSVELSFDPVDSALDYRVFVLPNDSDITTTSDGYQTVENAVYRCAGNRQTPPTAQDAQDWLPGGAIKTLVDGQDVNGYTRSLAESTIGYGYRSPGDGRVPVYALGNPDPRADNDCYFARWNETRVKRYTISEDERTQLLAQGYRDDGIAFYAPTDGAAQILTKSDLDLTTMKLGWVYYWPDGPETAKRPGAEPAFKLLDAAGDDTVPIKRVFYLNQCGAHHDELVAGDARFQKARYQGDALPQFRLHWAPIQAETTLVVEALDNLCPELPGNLSVTSRTGRPTPFTGTPWPDWLTVDQATALSSHQELFINGQGPGTNQPRPFARSFVKIKPGPQPKLDFFAGFSSDADGLGNLQLLDNCGGAMPCFQTFRLQSDRADVEFMNVETDRYALGNLLGELWVNYSDLGADVNGKFRITPSTAATVSDDQFLYATMQVNSFTTARRYPQIIISDQDAPVQHHFVDGNSLVIQTFGDWPYLYEVEICDHRDWDVNNQCPRVDLHHVLDPNDSTTVLKFMPNAEVGEHVGMDQSTHFEVYASTKRVYLFLDGDPFACVDLPASGAGVPKGHATVTFGDVLYHSDADQLQFYDYASDKFHYDTQRHFDNLGFKSGVAEPAWDEGRLPCASVFK
jgi:hypothetical protein